MRFSEKMKSIATEARNIQESLEVFDPREKGYDPSYGPSPGERMVRSRNSPQWKARVAECAKLFAEVIKGDRPSWHLKEAMVTSDFPDLFGDLLHRQLLGAFRAWEPTYPAYFRIFDLNDFRKLNLLTIDGGQTLLPIVTQREPYKEIIFTEGKFQLQVVKHGQRYGISFEMACEAFFDPFVWIADEESVGDETRDTIVGMTLRWKVLCVIYTVRIGDRYRIISAREATPAERQDYEGQ